MESDAKKRVGHTKWGDGICFFKHEENSYQNYTKYNLY